MMDKFIYNETNGLWYELQGDYYLPCLKLPKEESRHIGVWGQWPFLFHVFHRAFVIFKPVLDSSGGGMLYFATIRYIRQERNI